MPRRHVNYKKYQGKVPEEERNTVRFTNSSGEAFLIDLNTSPEEINLGQDNNGMDTERPPNMAENVMDFLHTHMDSTPQPEKVSSGNEGTSQQDSESTGSKGIVHSIFIYLLFYV